MSGLLPTTYEKEKIKTKQVKQKSEMGNGKWHNQKTRKVSPKSGKVEMSPAETREFKVGRNE